MGGLAWFVFKTSVNPLRMSYEVMTSDRPSRKALSHDTAVAELRANAGRQFDPGIVKLFVRLLEWEGPESAFVC